MRNRNENPSILPRRVVRPSLTNRPTGFFPFDLLEDEVEDNPGAAMPVSTKGTIAVALSHNTSLSSQKVKELEKNDTPCNRRIPAPTIPPCPISLLLQPSSSRTREVTMANTHPIMRPVNRAASSGPKGIACIMDEGRKDPREYVRANVIAPTPADVFQTFGTSE